MPTIKIKKTKNYTVMSNNHLRNCELSLKAMGLLSQMFSNRDDWDYSVRGLSKMSKDGIDSINSALKELEKHGYLSRERIRNAKGQLVDIEYTIREQPITATPSSASPILENPILDLPRQEKQVQINKNLNHYQQKEITNLANINSIPFSDTPEVNGNDTSKTYRIYEEIIKENIEYEHLVEHGKHARECLDEIVSIMLETVCTEKKTLRIAGDNYPAELVKSKFLKLNSSHIEFVMRCLEENTTKVRNIKQYLKAVLFNAPSTIENYYRSQVNHDMYG